MSEARAVLAEATARLVRAGIGNAAGDALALMAHALEVPRHALRDALAGPLPPEAAARFQAAVSALFERQGLQEIAIRPDLDGRDRVVLSRRTA